MIAKKINATGKVVTQEVDTKKDDIEEVNKQAKFEEAVNARLKYSSLKSIHSVIVVVFVSSSCLRSYFTLSL